MKVLEYHSDRGCRKGCHPVSIQSRDGRKTVRRHYFSVDKPGSWFEKQWNCHADGCDHPCDSREEAIRKGIEILCCEPASVVLVFANRPFYER